MPRVELAPEQSGNVTYKITMEDDGTFTVVMVDWIEPNQGSHSMVGQYKTEDEARQAARNHARPKVTLGPVPKKR